MRTVIVRFAPAFRWLLRLAGVVALSIVASMPSSAASCDLQARKLYPMQEALASRAIPLRMPALFFKDQDQTSDDDMSDLLPDAAGTARNRAALERGLATFAPIEREVLMLAAIDSWTSAPDGLLTFFVLGDGAFLDEVLETLDGAGLTEHAALFRTGRAIFGQNYGTPRERYDRWNDGDGGVRDAVLDAELRALSSAYRALPELKDEAVRRIAASPDLTAIYEPLRRAASDDDKLAYLAGGLWTCLDHYGSPDEVAARLAALPEPYARIITVYIFEAEMLNGSVEQFFFNSSGTLAPELVLALRAMKLPAHADAVQKGIDMFPTPYPRQLEARRTFMLAQGDGFDEALYELTGIVDDGEMRNAMIRIAREADILPK